MMEKHPTNCPDLNTTQHTVHQESIQEDGMESVNTQGWQNPVGGITSPNCGSREKARRELKRSLEPADHVGS